MLERHQKVLFLERCYQSRVLMSDINESSEKLSTFNSL
jgi:hypothetical protein